MIIGELNDYRRAANEVGDIEGGDAVTYENETTEEIEENRIKKLSTCSTIF